MKNVLKTALSYEHTDFDKLTFPDKKKVLSENSSLTSRSLALELLLSVSLMLCP